jgi:hypothetical protein
MNPLVFRTLSRNKNIHSEVEVVLKNKKNDLS